MLPANTDSASEPWSVPTAPTLAPHKGPAEASLALCTWRAPYFMVLDGSAQGSSEKSQSSLEESGHLLLADDRRAPPTPPGWSVPADPQIHPSQEVAQALRSRKTQTD